MVGLTPVVVIGTVVAGTWWALAHWLDGPGAVTDERSCGRSTVAFDTAVDRYGVAPPDGATEVRYWSVVNPMFGEYTLALSFRTTPQGLRDFLHRTGLPPAAPLTAQDDPPPLPCPGGTGGFHASLFTAEPAGDGNGRERTVAVDTSDPQRPLVVVDAFDS